MVVQSVLSKVPPIVTWEILPDTYRLDDDPVENIQQPRLAAGLNDAFSSNNRMPAEGLVASNFALTATINQKTVVKAPDWLYVPRINQTLSQIQPIRRSYAPWTEGDGVAIVMEFLSEDDNGEHSSRDTPPYGKLYFYEQIVKVPTYVIFDPHEGKMDVRQLQDGIYQITPHNADDRVWIPEVELFLGVWIGRREGVRAQWLRWWDSQGNLLLWASEQTEQERQRVELERQRADQEQVRADQEQMRADQEQVRADQEQVRADQAEAERDRLVTKLKALGLDDRSE